MSKTDLRVTGEHGPAAPSPQLPPGRHAAAPAPPADDATHPAAKPAAQPATAPSPGASRPPVVVKKYANRRLYNTDSSSYVTLEDLAAMVRQRRDFAVYDARSGEEITRAVLTQIIVEEEAKGRSLLPENFLRQLIGFYGDSLQTILPKYLEFAMAGFARQQEQMRHGMQHTMGGMLPFPAAFGGLEELGKQNVAMMERAMSLFAPFRPPGSPRPAAAAPDPESEATRAVVELQGEVDRLRAQLADLQAATKTRSDAV